VFARSTTFQAAPWTIDEGIAYVRDEVMPAALATEDCIGLSMICDRESGRCITTSAWSTTGARDASGRTLRPLLERGGEILGAEPTIDLWEIVVLHRHGISGEGACVRCTWLSLDKSELTHAIRTYKMAMLPAYEEMGGFVSASLMIDRDTGRAVSSATFDTRDAMVASRPASERLRARTGQDLGTTVTDMQEFELAIPHLHLPEMR
jgi:hypothetical protein